jgi:hypothetical protein
LVFFEDAAQKENQSGDARRTPKAIAPCRGNLAC